MISCGAMTWVAGQVIDYVVRHILASAKYDVCHIVMAQVLCLR